MSYEKSIDLITNDEDILTGKAQIDYLNELEELCKTCDRVWVHSEIARTIFSHRRFMEKFAARRGFTIQFGIKENSFCLDRVADSKILPVDEIIQNHKEDACLKAENNKKATTHLRERKILP